MSETMNRYKEASVSHLDSELRSRTNYLDSLMEAANAEKKQVSLIKKELRKRRKAIPVDMPDEPVDVRLAS